MADNEDQNNKPNKPFIPEDQGYESIKRIGRRYANPSAEDLAERQKLQVASETINGLEELIEDRPELANAPTIQKGLASARETIKRFGPRVSLRRESRRERAIRETTTAIEREFSSRAINGQVAEIGSQVNAQARGLSMSGRSQREIEEFRYEVMGEIGAAEREAADIAQNQLYDKEGRQNPEAVENLRAVYRRKRAATQRLASANVALKKQRQAGEDEASQDEGLLRAGQAAKGLLFKSQVSQELQSGEGLGALSMSQLKQQETEQAKGLVDALERLRNSTNESVESIEKMKEEARDAADSLKKTQEAIGQRGGQPDNQAGLGALKMAAGILNVAAGAAQEILINQPLQTLGTRAGFANLSNQMYNQRNAAIGGDMTALLSATQNVGQKMSDVGGNFRENADIVRGLGAGAGAITAGLGVAQSVNAAKNAGVSLGLTGVSEFTGGVNMATQGLAQAAVAGGDMINQSSRQAAALAGQQSIYNLNQEVNAVRGDFRQSFFDYSMGTRQAALAAGGTAGRNIMNEFAADQGGETGMLGRMQRARIAPQRFAEIQAQAALEQGSVFSTEQIFQARALERSGQGTMEMNMQRMGQLASAGANNPQTAFASVLESAFSKSLDSSKALNLMVDNTAEMARVSAGATRLGIETTGAAAQRLAALTNADMPNREMALTRAATAEQRLEQINTGIGTNFSDMLATTRMAREGGTNMVTAMNLKKLDNSTADALQQQLREYQQMNPNEKNSAEGQNARAKLESALFKAGAGDFVGPNGEIKTEEAQRALRARGLSTLTSGNFLNLVNPRAEGYNELMTGELSGEQIKQNPRYRELRRQVSSAAALSELTEDEVYAQIQRANGISPITGTGKQRAGEALAGRGATAEQIAADEAATAQGADMANKARLAAKELGGAAEALGKINRQMQSLVGQLSDKTSESFQGAAGEAAEKFKNSADTFYSAVGKFNEGIKVLDRIPTSTGDAVKQAIQPLVDKVQSLGNSGGDDRAKAGPKG